MACRNLCAREPKFSAEILAPIAHQGRLSAKVLSAGLIFTRIFRVNSAFGANATTIA